MVVVKPKPAVVAKVGPVAVVVQPKPAVKVVHAPHHRRPHHPPAPVHAKPIVVVKPMPKPMPKPVVAVSAPTFHRENAYEFARNNLVLIRLSNGHQLRVHPRDANALDSHGAKGVLARWFVEVHGGGIVKLRNRSSGKYLRMRGDGGIDAKGAGKAWCEWRVVKAGKGVAKLQSKAHAKFLAFRDGRVVAGKGGPFCKLTFIRKD